MLTCLYPLNRSARLEPATSSGAPMVFTTPTEAPEIFSACDPNVLASRTRSAGPPSVGVTSRRSVVSVKVGTSTSSCCPEAQTPVHRGPWVFEVAEAMGPVAPATSAVTAAARAARRASFRRPVCIDAAPSLRGGGPCAAPVGRSLVGWKGAYPHPATSGRQ